MTRLIILGAGGHGAVVAEAAILSRRWDLVRFLDDNLEEGESVVDCSVIGKISVWPELLAEDNHFFVAIGNNERRDQLLASIEQKGGGLAHITHPGAVVSPSAVIEPGTVICGGAVINARTSVGRGAIVNTCASIDHDCTLGRSVHISPGAHLGGSVAIGNKTWVGIGAVVKDGISIGSDCIVGAGAAVVSDVKDGSTVIGVPAVPVRAI
jgi:sugar O-acyltransferase (sialic acid O-acetyltransferase NeuD family)